MTSISQRCHAIASSSRFQKLILLLILTNAVLMGIETSVSLMELHGQLLLALNAIVQSIFVLEIAVRLAAHGRRPLAFFRDGWNTFDFGVVALSLLPASGALTNLARLARILRSARLISNLPDLRLIIGTMLRSIPSMGHVLSLLGLLMYVYGVIGVHLFGKVDPDHWGSLAQAASTLFQILTLEGWVEILAAGREGHPAAWLFYASFIVIAVFVVINLFIAVVINNLETTRREEEIGSAESTAAHIQALRRQIDALERSLSRNETAV